MQRSQPRVIHIRIRQKLLVVILVRRGKVRRAPRLRKPLRILYPTNRNPRIWRVRHLNLRRLKPRIIQSLAHRRRHRRKNLRRLLHLILDADNFRRCARPLLRAPAKLHHDPCIHIRLRCALHWLTPRIDRRLPLRRVRLNCPLRQRPHLIQHHAAEFARTAAVVKIRNLTIRKVIAVIMRRRVLQVLHIRQILLQLRAHRILTIDQQVVPLQYLPVHPLAFIAQLRIRRHTRAPAKPQHRLMHLRRVYRHRRILRRLGEQTTCQRQMFIPRTGKHQLLPRQIKQQRSHQHALSVQQHCHREMRIHHHRQLPRMPHILLLLFAHCLVRIVPSTIQRSRVIKPLHQPHLRARQLHRQPRTRSRKDPRQLRPFRHIAIKLQSAREQRRQLALEIDARNRIRPRPPRPHRPIAHKLKSLRHTLRRRLRLRQRHRLLRVRHAAHHQPTHNPRPHQRSSAQSHLGLASISILRPRLSTIISSSEFSISSPKSIKMKIRDHPWPQPAATPSSPSCFSSSPFPSAPSTFPATTTTNPRSLLTPCSTRCASPTATPSTPRSSGSPSSAPRSCTSSNRTSSASHPPQQRAPSHTPASSSTTNTHSTASPFASRSSSPSIPHPASHHPHKPSAPCACSSIFPP